MLYLLACLKNLQEGTSLYPSICIALSIIQGLDNASGDEAGGLDTLKAIQLLEKQLGLVGIILHDITCYDG